MADLYSFETKRKQLTPEQILENATAEGQDKVMIVSLKQDGEVSVYSSDDIKPSDLLFMCYTAVDLAGVGALTNRNTNTFFDNFKEQ